MLGSRIWLSEVLAIYSTLVFICCPSPFHTFKLSRWMSELLWLVARMFVSNKAHAFSWSTARVAGTSLVCKAVGGVRGKSGEQGDGDSASKAFYRSPCDPGARCQQSPSPAQQREGSPGQEDIPERGSEMVWWAKAFAAQPDDLNSLPRTHMVEGEYRLLLVSIWPPHVHCDVFSERERAHLLNLW